MVAVTGNGERISIAAGLENLVLLRTAGFAPTTRGRVGDDPSDDGLQRVFVAALSARWSYMSGDVAFAPCRQGVRAAIVETFAWHRGRSAHETLTTIADVVLATYQDISDVALTLHERPYRPTDVLELSLDGDALFVAHDEPIGIVEIAVARPN
jgi:urate oxidase